MKPLPASARLLSRLSSEERLALLQEHDRLRSWQDVNDVRTCMCCGRKLSGRLIQIWSDQADIWFRCPGPGCTGSLPNFARAGEPLFDNEIWEDWCKTIESLDEAI
jgi:hypothetical protein